MDTTILVITVIAASLAILTVVAFRRGWLRLATVPSDTKGHFVLMLKKDKIQNDTKKSS